MPDARGHDIITVITGFAMLPPAYAAYSASQPQQVAVPLSLLFGAHLLSGMLFSPDLDLDSAIDDRWGWFSWIWWLYTWLIPHRHFWSHGLILPPLLRLAYFFGALFLLIFVLARGLAALGMIVPDYHIRLANALMSLANEHPTETQVFLLGFITGGAAHTIADWLVTGGKRYLSRLGFRSRRSYANHDYSIHRSRSW
ncbi:MAG: metal-binding protein [Roseiflexaceae bacterium]|nr:metal-binding protein [Roseiflexaceae bacterium]